MSLSHDGYAPEILLLLQMYFDSSRRRYRPLWKFSLRVVGENSPHDVGYLFPDCNYYIIKKIFVNSFFKHIKKSKGGMNIV